MSEEREIQVSENNKPAIGVNEAGLLQPKSLDEAYRMAVAFHKSKLLPSRFSTPEMILTAMQYTLELGLKPLTAMRQLAVINGTPSFYGDLPLSLCYSNGKLEWIKEYLIDKDLKQISAKNQNLTTEVFGAVCVVKRKGDPEELETFFTMKEAELAGLLKSPTWKTYPKYMLKYRARSQALKDKFPDALNGISIAEYDFNVIPTESDGVKQVAYPSNFVTPVEVTAKLMEKVDAPVLEARPASEAHT